MKIAYIAGPYRAKTIEHINWNIQHAGTIAYYLWKMGYAVICPHTNSTFDCRSQVDDGIPYIEGDLEIISRLHAGKDCLVMLLKWETSQGATAEKIYAEHRGLKIYYWPQDKERF